MKKKKGAVLTLVGLCLVCVVIGACAATAVTQITAELRPDFTVVIDGQTRTFKNVNGDVVEPILYEGSVYLPLRAIGEIMGKTVVWNEAEKKAELKDEKSTVTDADVIIPDNSAQPQASGGSGAAPSTPAQPDTPKISEEQAKAIALQRAGLTADQVRFDRTSMDREKGVLVYELEFYYNRTEYSADINAEDGSIVSWEEDRD